MGRGGTGAAASRPPVDVSALVLIPDNEEFLHEAYRRILGRESDLAGFVHYLTLLQNNFPRRVIVRQLITSAEGRLKGALLPGEASESAGTARSPWRRPIEFVYRSVLRRLRRLAEILLQVRRIQILEGKIDLLLREIETRSEIASAKSDQSLWTISEKLDRYASMLNTGEVALRAEMESQSDQAHSILRDLAGRMDRLEESVSAIDLRIRPPVLLGGEGVLATEVNGFIVGVPREEWRLAAYLAFRGVPEPGLTRQFQLTARPGMVVVDVGANVGLYTLLGARAVGAQGKVYSFEPAPRNFGLLKDNVQVNGFLEGGTVIVRQQAVCERRGERLLTIYPANGGHNTFFPETEGETIRVEAIVLDEALKEEAHIDLVKIDAEGSEPLVLRGMTRILARNRDVRIFLEFAPVQLRRAGVQPRDFLDEIESMGLTLRRVEDVSGDLLPVNKDELAQCFSAILSLHREP